MTADLYTSSLIQSRSPCPVLMFKHPCFLLWPFKEKRPPVLFPSLIPSHCSLGLHVVRGQTLAAATKFISVSITLASAVHLSL